MGWLAGIEHTSTALVAVAVLYHDRLVDRVLDRLPGLAAADDLDAGRVRVSYPQCGCRRSGSAQATARSDGGKVGGCLALQHRRRSAAARLCPSAGARGFRRQLRSLSWRRWRRRQRLPQSQRRRLALGRQARRYRAYDSLRCPRRRRQGAGRVLCRLSAGTIF